MLEQAFRPETSLVSVMAVNNEIGVVQPITEIGKVLDLQDDSIINVLFSTK